MAARALARPTWEEYGHWTDVELPRTDINYLLNERVAVEIADPQWRSRVTSTTTTLYRPVGQYELELIEESAFRAFPPRLSHQPLFYPVLTEAYAVEIARDWNTKDAASGYVGYVTRFAMDAAFLARYPVRVAGAKRHQELWVPADELTEFNRHIVGRIEVIAEFRGPVATIDGPTT